MVPNAVSPNADVELRTPGYLSDRVQLHANVDSTIAFSGTQSLTKRPQ